MEKQVTEKYIQYDTIFKAWEHDKLYVVFCAYVCNESINICIVIMVIKFKIALALRREQENGTRREEYTGNFYYLFLFLSPCLFLFYS